MFSPSLAMLSMLARHPARDYPRQTWVSFQQNACVKSAPLAFGCVLLLALAGCGGGDDSKPSSNTSLPPTGQPTGILQGTLQTVGGPAPGKPEPIAGTVTITGPNGSTTKAQVDGAGAFAIGLYPGRYQVRGTSPLVNDGRTACTTKDSTVTLTAGKTVTVAVTCSLK